MAMYDPRRNRTDMPLNIGALPDDVDQMRMRREEASSGRQLPLNMGSMPDDVDQRRRDRSSFRKEFEGLRELPLNMRSMPDDSYTGDGDPMDDSLRAEGPTADRLERLISLYGIPFEVAITIADYMPPFDLIEGGEEEERDIALDLQNMLLNELSGNVDKTIEASPVEMDMRENYTR